MSLTIGIRPGTHPAPVLPEIVIPRWARPARTAHSPMPYLSGEGTMGEIGTDTHEVATGRDNDEPALGASDFPDEPHGGPHRKKGVKKGRGKWPRNKPDFTQQVVSGPRRGAGGKFLKLNGPSKPENLQTDPQEPIYCYCRRVSFGQACGVVICLYCYSIQLFPQMIACDKNNCVGEWVSIRFTTYFEEKLTTVVSSRMRWSY